MGLQIAVKWLSSWVALLLLSVVTAEGLHFATADLDPGALQITLAFCQSWLAVLLIPIDSGQQPKAGAIALWAAMAVAGFLTLSLLLPYFGQGSNSFQLAGAVLILVLLFSSMQSLSRTFAASYANSMILFTLVTGALLAAPLYLGVVAEAAPNQSLLVDSIIAASPLSYLAGIADYDYLRSNWFYQHTPFGGLRFNYPAPGVMTVCYIVTTLMLAGLNFHRNKPELGKLEQ